MPMEYKNSKRFKTELKKSILLVSVSLVVVFFMLFYVFINILGKTIISNNNKKTNANVSKRINDQILTYENYILNEFEPTYGSSILDVIENRQTLFEVLYRFSDQQEINSLFYVFDYNGDLLLTNSYAQNPYDIEFKFLSGIFRQMQYENNNVVMRVNKQQLSNNLRTLYSIGKTITVDDEVVGYLVFDIIESQLNSLIQENPVDIIVVTDRYQNSIISTDTTVLSNISKFEPVIVDNNYTTSIRNQQHYIYKNKVANDRIIVYTLSSMQFLNSLFYTGLAVQVFVAIIALFVLMAIANRYSNKNTQSLDALLSAIDKVKQGDLNVQLDIKTYEEFNKVSTYFNEMLFNLKSLMVENNELSQRKNVAEIKQLEAQFNPHFLFNALEALKYLIRLNSKEAEKFILSLSKLLRYSITYENQFVSLEQDIVFIEDYLKISQFRFGDRLRYTLNICEESKQAIIPKLIIQPLIENSLQHGYFGQNMHVTIKTYVADECLIIEVIDNGIGFDQDHLIAIHQMLTHKKNKTKHIGLYNVHRRIQLQYGHQFGMSIDSIRKQQTIVQLKLPLQVKEDKQ